MYKYCGGSTCTFTVHLQVLNESVRSDNWQTTIMKNSTSTKIWNYANSVEESSTLSLRCSSIICDASTDDNKSEDVPSISIILTSSPGPGYSDKNDQDGRARGLVIDCLACCVCNFDASTSSLSIQIDN